jgi:hypothetical protein
MRGAIIESQVCPRPIIDARDAAARVLTHSTTLREEDGGAGADCCAKSAN